MSDRVARWTALPTGVCSMSRGWVMSKKILISRLGCQVVDVSRLEAQAARRGERRAGDPTGKPPNRQTGQVSDHPRQPEKPDLILCRRHAHPGLGQSIMRRDLRQPDPQHAAIRRREHVVHRSRLMDCSGNFDRHGRAAASDTPGEGYTLLGRDRDALVETPWRSRLSWPRSGRLRCRPAEAGIVPIADLVRRSLLATKSPSEDLQGRRAGRSIGVRIEHDADAA